MSRDQILLLIVAPIGLGILANLATGLLRKLGTRVSGSYRDRRARAAQETQELVGAFAQRPEFATHFLIVGWVMTTAVYLIAFTSILTAISVTSSGDQGTGIALAGLASLAFFVALSRLRRVRTVYEQYLGAVDAPEVVTKAIIGG